MELNYTLFWPLTLLTDREQKPTHRPFFICHTAVKAQTAFPSLPDLTSVHSGSRRDNADTAQPNNYA